MKIIALEHESPTATAEQFRLYLKDEATQLWNLVQSGVVRETYFRSDQHTAVLILECQDLDEAEHALSTLPLVRQGLISFELLPLQPYSGFERLFATNS
jgi:hypothetical protein